MTKNQLDADLPEENEISSGARPKHIADKVEENTSTETDLKTPLCELSFDNEIFSAGCQKTRLTWRQKRKNSHCHTSEMGESGEAKPTLDLSANKLRELQEQDSTLDTARRAVQTEITSAGFGFFLCGRLLYCRYTPPGYHDNGPRWRSNWCYPQSAEELC